MGLLGFGNNLATHTYADQGAQTPGNDAVSAAISGIVKWAMTPNRQDNPSDLFNAPVIHIGQLNWALKTHFVKTAQGQGFYTRDRH